jgi:hypothetical protein
LKLNGSSKTKSDGTLRLAHVVNFFPCAKDCDSLFAPVNQAQNVTFASMIRAMESTTKAVVTVYAAMFPGDEYIVPPNFIILSKRLQRSTMTEYPELLKRKLQFLDDIISSLYDSVNTKMIDYVVYTNSDIGLKKSFYDKVAAIIEHGLDGFSINRWTVDPTFNGKLLSGNDLDLIYNMTGKAHPGTDCVIFKKELYRNNFTLGNVFLGHVGIGQALRVSVDNAAKKYWWFGTFEANATFHLGDERLWKKDTDTIGKVNRKNLQTLFQGRVPKEGYFWKPSCPNDGVQKNVSSCHRVIHDLL